MWRTVAAIRWIVMDEQTQAEVEATGGITTSTIEAREKQRRALQMRTAGASYADIEAQLGYAEGGAAKAIKRLLARTDREAVADFIQLQQDRVEQLLLVAWSPAMKGDSGAWDRSLKAIQQLDNYYGIGGRGGETAVTVNVNGDGNNEVMVIKGDRAAFLAGLKEMAEDAGHDFSTIPDEYLGGVGIVDAEVVDEGTRDSLPPASRDGVDPSQG